MGGWSWVRQLGTTSLLVYWVHVDLEYGPWFAKYRQQLTVPEVLVSAAVLIACMVGVSVTFTRVRKRFQPKLEPMPVVELPLRSEEKRRRA